MSKPVDPAQIAKVPTEHAQQVALFAWAALQFSQYPELKLMFAIPNGGERNKIVAAHLKAEGVKSGVPDIFLPVPRGTYHGLFIELKKVGGSAQASQKDFIAALQRNGYGACVCVGYEAAKDTILSYLKWQ